MASKIDKDMKPFRKAEIKPQRLLWGVLEVDRFLLKPGFQRWFIAVLLAVVLAFLFQYPRMEEPEVRVYSDGDIAEEDIYAPRDFLFVDENATKGKRGKAVEETPPVFDYDTALAKNIEKRLRNSFKNTRNFFQREWDWIDAEKNRISYLRTNYRRRRVRPLPFIPDDDYADQEEELKSRFADMLSDITGKPLDLTDRMWSELRKDRFSTDTENKIATLFLQVMNEGVVLSKDHLPTVKGRGITVRILPQTGSGDEYPKGDVSSIHELDDVQKLIKDRAYSQYGREIPWALRNTIVELARQLVRPNHTFNYAQTQIKKQRASESVSEAYIRIRKGEKIIGQGEPIEKEDMIKLALVKSSYTRTHSLMTLGGNFMWLLAFISVLYTFSARNIRKFTPTTKDLLHMALLTVLLTAMLKLTLTGAEGIDSHDGLVIAYLIPMMAGAMMMRLVINSEVALVFSVGISIISALLTHDPIYGLYVLVGSVVGAEEVGQARLRSTLVKAGLMTGAVNVVIVLAVILTEGLFVGPSTFYNLLFALGGGIFAGFLVLGITPVVENMFGYVTDIRLLELANQEHPLLKELIINAPGTYQHSITVGILAEEAATAIHVNPLLVKVAALYHDVGKMEKPDYFVENQRDSENPHDKLNPNMSSLIITSHVKYGIELAKMYRLPQVIVDAIPEHHGTSLIKYFYAKAKEREDPDLSAVEEEDYRYPGPKPQTREAGILMLADSVEATARSLSEPTPTKLQGMVRKIILGIFNDGQLDECELTLKDLNAIAEAFTKVLSSMYHSRPEYPELPGGKQENERKKVADKNSLREHPQESNGEGKGENSETDKKNTVRSRM